jgi:hypothetical protein
MGKSAIVRPESHAKWPTCQRLPGQEPARREEGEQVEHYLRKQQRQTGHMDTYLSAKGFPHDGQTYFRAIILPQKIKAKPIKMGKMSQNPQMIRTKPTV